MKWMLHRADKKNNEIYFIYANFDINKVDGILLSSGAFLSRCPTFSHFF